MTKQPDSTEPIPTTLFLRKDLTLMICGGDRAMEIALTPKTAANLAAEMLATALDLAPREVMDVGCEIISQAIKREKQANLERRNGEATE